MKRSFTTEAPPNKRLKDLELAELNPIMVDDFLCTLRIEVAGRWAQASSAFRGVIPEAMLDHIEGEKSNIIAYDIQKHVSKNDNVIYLRQAQLTLIDEVKESKSLTDVEAMEILFPKEGKTLREKMRQRYMEAVEAIIAYAETKIALHIMNNFESDPEYCAIRQNLCLIGWILYIKHKALNNTTAVELSRDAIIKELDKLNMTANADTFLEFKKKFTELTSNLKLISKEFDEKHYSNLFLSKLNKRLFGDFFTDMLKSGQTENLSAVLRATETHFKEVIMVKIHYTKVKTIPTLLIARQQNGTPARQNNRIINNKGVKSNSVSNINSTIKEKIPIVCRNYIPFQMESCKNNKCRFVHAESAEHLKKLKEAEAILKAAAKEP